MTTESMKGLKWGAAALVLLAIGAGGGYWWAHRTPAPTVTPSASERRVLYWQDPMATGKQFDKPGKSPYMDMPLVPVYADEAGAGADVKVSANVSQNLGIRLGKVEKVTLGERMRAVGSVAFDERLLELVQARVEGYVTRLYVRAPLERVHRGQPLAVILAPQWAQAEQEYLALLDTRSERAQSLRDAARQRLLVLGLSEAAIQAVEKSRTASAETTIIAPIDGAVTELGVREGAAFMPGMVLFRINGLATVWVNAQVPEAKLAMIPIGSDVSASATAWPAETFKGRVIALLPEVDRETRTITARVAVENPGFRLSPGMFISIELTKPSDEPRLVVPSEAVITTGERSVVIVATDGGFNVVDVAPGMEQQGRTEILSGLVEGQSIVLSGQFLIDSEANLKSTVNRLDAQRKP